MKKFSEGVIYIARALNDSVLMFFRGCVYSFPVITFMGTDIQGEGLFSLCVALGTIHLSCCAVAWLFMTEEQREAGLYKSGFKNVTE